jgi:hypothetical protein
MAIFSKPKQNAIKYYTTQEHSQHTDGSGLYLRNQSDEFVYAKKVLDHLSKDIVRGQLSFSYYVRYNNGHIFDPRSIHSIPETKGNYVDKICKNDILWIKVTEAAFISYLEFLKLGGDQHYKNASRACAGI